MDGRVDGWMEGGAWDHGKEGRVYGQVNGNRYVWTRLSVLSQQLRSRASHWQLRLLGPDAKSVPLGSKLPRLASVSLLSRLSEWELRAAGAQGSFSSSPTCRQPPRAPAPDSRNISPKV